MNTPCIHIVRHDTGIYGWKVAIGNEPIDADDGDSSITDCLIGAARGLPEEVKIVEIRYRGLHMGTFQKDDLFERAGETASSIVGMYGELVDSL